MISIPLLETPITPVALGPTWQLNPAHDPARDDFLDKYVLPELTLGWQVLDWAADGRILGDDGEPFSCTFEQSRFILWWYAVDEDGRFAYRNGVLQRLKGWLPGARTRSRRS